jgi:hypothetical protein
MDIEQLRYPVGQLQRKWGDVPIEESLSMYSWHCRHHAAYIALALSRPVSLE